MANMGLKFTYLANSAEEEAHITVNLLLVVMWQYNAK